LSPNIIDNSTKGQTPDSELDKLSKPEEPKIKQNNIDTKAKDLYIKWAEE
jgi:hypothetical protein